MLRNIVIALNLLAIIFVFVAFYFGSNLSPTFSNQKELKKFQDESLANASAEIISIPKLTINLASNKGKLHYLDTEIKIVPVSEKDSAEFKKIESQIMSIIIEVAGQFTPDQITSVSGKIILAEKIKQIINLRLDQKLVAKVLFTSFVVQ